MHDNQWTYTSNTNDKVGRFIMCINDITIPTRSLVPVTQLYVSVDASTKESLKKIDRPLFRDFWPRFVGSLEALSEKVSELCCCRNTPSRLRASVYLSHSGPEDSVPPDIGQGVEHGRTRSLCQSCRQRKPRLH